ncbi:MAG TPA: hypothetical protein PLX33_11420, partial [Alphaproteobacteria bacterium]|nr:hypothetical protein [Alphaproteobacteria bacterium]
ASASFSSGRAQAPHPPTAKAAAPAADISPAFKNCRRFIAAPLSIARKQYNAKQPPTDKAAGQLKSYGKKENGSLGKVRTCGQAINSCLPPS